MRRPLSLLLASCVLAVGGVACATPGAAATPAPHFTPEKTLRSSSETLLGAATDSLGDVFIADVTDRAILSQRPGETTWDSVGAEPLSFRPVGVAYTDQGGTYATGDSGGVYWIPRADSPGVRMTQFEGIARPWGIAADPSGDLFVTDVNGNGVYELPYGANSVTRLPITDLVDITSVAVDSGGNVWVLGQSSDYSAAVVEELPQGSDSPVPAMRIAGGAPAGLGIDGAGDVFAATRDLHTFTGTSITEDDQVDDTFTTTLLDGSQNLSDLAVDPAGDLFLPDQDGHVFEMSVFHHTPITFTAPAAGTGTYGGSVTLAAAANNGPAPVTFRVSSSSGSGVCSLGSDGVTLTYTGVGKCTIIAGQAAQDGYPGEPQIYKTITVGKAPLTVSIAKLTRTFGQDNPALGSSSVTYTGLQGDDTAAGAVSGTLTYTAHATIKGVGYYASPTSPPGSYTVYPSGLTSTNYTLTYATHGLTVGKAPVTVTPTVTGPVTRGTTPAYRATATGLRNGEDISVLGTLSYHAKITVHGTTYTYDAGDPNAPPGTYRVYVTGGSSPNYSITYATGTMQVTAQPAQ